MKTLDGKVAIVTGSSKGIGAGIALRLAADGAKVIVNSPAAQRMQTPWFAASPLPAAKAWRCARTLRSPPMSGN